jgi:hypothetical protein
MFIDTPRKTPSRFPSRPRRHRQLWITNSSQIHERTSPGAWYLSAIVGYGRAIVKEKSQEAHAEQLLGKPAAPPYINPAPPPWPSPKEITKDGAILNWDAPPDGKTLYAVEMSTNQLFAFDLTAGGDTVPGRRLGALLPQAKATDCRALAVSPAGKVWMALTEQGRPEGPLTHLVSFTPGTKTPRDHGPVGIANPDYVSMTDEKGKPRPWHHTLRREKDGTLTPWVPLGVCAGADGSVCILTLAPLTVLRFTPEQLR